MQAILMGNSDVVKAMEILFGQDFNCHEGTLRYIQLSGIKKAFRTKALLCHPDHLGKQEQEVVDFHELQDAYNLLMDLKQKEVPVRFHSKMRPQPESFRTKPATARSTGDFYYTSKTLPSIPLRLGEYLYYSGKISWRTLIDAIVEQRKGSSRLFGEYFIRRGLLKREQLQQTLREVRLHNLGCQ